MNRIVRENYPVSKLPDDLRHHFDSSSVVTVILQETGEQPKPEQVMKLEEIWAMRRPPFRSAEEIDADIRRERDRWDD